MHSEAPAADALLAELGIFQPHQIEVEVIAQHCGATVIYEPLQGCEARVIGLGSKAIIRVNNQASRGRQRFSAAHELAHWLLDRGRVASACSHRTISSSWGADREARANVYASDLLLPHAMFIERTRKCEVTFDTIDSLRELFSTSLTATAIRLVTHGYYPAMLICSSGKGREWFVASPDIRRNLWPVKMPGPNTAAFELLRGSVTSDRPVDVDADGWIEREGAENYAVREHSRRLSSGRVLTLLWWKDQTQLNDLTED